MDIINHEKLRLLIEHSRVEDLESRDRMLASVMDLGQPPARVLEYRLNKEKRLAKERAVMLGNGRKGSATRRKAKERSRRRRRTIRYKEDSSAQYIEWKRKLLAKGDIVEINENDYVELVKDLPLSYRLKRIDTKQPWQKDNVVVLGDW